MVVVDADTLNSRVEGSDPGCGPVSFGDVAMLAFRADIYGAVRDQRNVTINFGRFRRFASTLQRVAVIARDGGHCVFPGCHTDHERCEVHHVTEYEHGRRTDLENLALLCKARHAHLHRLALRLVRDGPTVWRIAPAKHGNRCHYRDQSDYRDTG